MFKQSWIFAPLLTLHFITSKCVYSVQVNIYSYTKLNWHSWIFYLRKTNLRFANIMKSIDFRLMYFLILYPSLSRLALWIECIAVNIEIVGSSLTTYNMLIFFSFFIINHDLHDLTRLTCKSICNRIHFKALY